LLERSRLRAVTLAAPPGGPKAPLGTDDIQRSTTTVPRDESTIRSVRIPEEDGLPHEVEFPDDADIVILSRSSLLVHRVLAPVSTGQLTDRISDPPARGNICDEAAC
jgi:hypothetical protein